MPGFNGRGPRGFGPGRGLGPCGQGLRRGRGNFGNRSGFLGNQTDNNQQNFINTDKQAQKRILEAEMQELEAEKKYLAQQIENLEKN